MNGREILVDNNIIIYLLQGDDTLEGLLEGKQLYISFISELELLGLPSLTQKEEKEIEKLLDDCLILPMNNNIKHHYKVLRKSHKLKLADSIVAATALTLDMPLMTADKQFRTIKNLQLLQYSK